MLIENFIFDQSELAPMQFQSIINKIATKIGAEDYKDVEITDDDVVIRFGDKSLPRDRNTVHIGGKFFNKEKQYRMMKGKVPTLKTYENYVEELGNNFIAKKKAGQKQQGQLDGVFPEDDTDYVFQPKVKIVKELRVITYYLNGKYYVSGIYEKSGSNVSFKSLPLSKNSEISKLATEATDIMKYGFAGVDVVVVHSSDNIHINESILGNIASMSMKAVGSFSDIENLLEHHTPVILEVNSFPSLANVGIAQDLLESIQSNSK